MSSLSGNHVSRQSAYDKLGAMLAFKGKATEKMFSVDRHQRDVCIQYYVIDLKLVVPQNGVSG